MGHIKLVRKPGTMQAGNRCSVHLSVITITIIIKFISFKKDTLLLYGLIPIL